MKVQCPFGTSATIYPATQLHIPEYLNSQCMLLYVNDFSLSYWSHGPITISIVLFWIYIACAYKRFGILIVATIYLQLIQNRYIFRSFTVLQCSHQHCVQPVASDVEVVGYL